jgi:hypothetical protein
MIRYLFMTFVAAENLDDVSDSSVDGPDAGRQQRRRGRPPGKHRRPSVKPLSRSPSPDKSPVIKKRRGRKPKNPESSATVDVIVQETTATDEKQASDTEN